MRRELKRWLITIVSGRIKANWLLFSYRSIKDNDMVYVEKTGWDMVAFVGDYEYARGWISPSVGDLNLYIF